MYCMKFDFYKNKFVRSELSAKVEWKMNEKQWIEKFNTGLSISKADNQYKALKKHIQCKYYSWLKTTIK